MVKSSVGSSFDDFLKKEGIFEECKANAAQALDQTDRDYSFFNLHRNEYLKKHTGQYVVIEKETVLGFYSNQQAALLAMKDHNLGTFIVHKIVPAELDIIWMR